MIFELVKRGHRDMSDMRLDIGEIKSELVFVRGHTVSVNGDIRNIHGMLARHDVRRERDALADAVAQYDPTGEPFGAAASAD